MSRVKIQGQGPTKILQTQRHLEDLNGLSFYEERKARTMHMYDLA
jgi:hypothetical protein